MYRIPVLAIFIYIQVGLMVLGIKTNPVLMIGFPIIGIFTIWLIYNPGVSLLLLALTGIIKGFLINIIPVFEVIDQIKDEIDVKDVFDMSEDQIIKKLENIVSKYQN